MRTKFFGRRRTDTIAEFARAAHFSRMVASVLGYPGGEAALEELLKPASSELAAKPEERVVFCGIPWNRYRTFDKNLGHDRPGPLVLPQR